MKGLLLNTSFVLDARACK